MKPKLQKHEVIILNIVSKAVTGKSLHSNIKRLNLGDIKIVPFKNKKTEKMYKQAFGRYMRNHKALNKKKRKI